MDKRPYLMTWCAQDQIRELPIASARGTEFVLEDGTLVTDFSSTSFQSSFGHSNEVILDRIKKQMALLATAFPKATTRQRHTASLALLKYLKLEEGRIFYTVSGAEAIENALKISRQLRKADLVLARERSYHGASMGALAVTGDWRNRAHKPVNDWTLRIPEPEADPDGSKTRDLIIRHNPKKIAAICLETITGANGVITPSAHWWTTMQALCDQYGIHMILDEVTCGFGRTGPAFAFHAHGLRPNFVAMSKSISAGYIPFGALWVEGQLAADYDKQILACGLTNYAHPLGLAAMESVIELLQDPEFNTKKNRLQAVFTDKLSTFKNHPNVHEVRQAGLLAALDLRDTCKLTWNNLIDRRIHANVHEGMLVMAPAFVMSEETLCHTLDTIHQLLSDLGG